MVSSYSRRRVHPGSKTLDAFSKIALQELREQYYKHDSAQLATLVPLTSHVDVRAFDSVLPAETRETVPTDGSKEPALYCMQDSSLNIFPYYAKDDVNRESCLCVHHLCNLHFKACIVLNQTTNIISIQTSD